MTRNGAEKQRTAQSFGQAAEAYRESAVHREGADLETIASWCGGADRAIDIGTGLVTQLSPCSRAGSTPFLRSMRRPK
ncbi:MAG: hypothetical protein U5K37_09775 [Natrialbaceae archaeon]|nr:hypothetical protein [Natrialbaceae archaeon]